MLHFHRQSICHGAVEAALENFTCEDGNAYSISSEHWQQEFPQHFENILVQSLQAPQDAVRIAQQGLQFLHSNVQYGDVALDFSITKDRKTNKIESSVIQGKQTSTTGEKLAETVSAAKKFVVDTKRADSTLINTLESVIPTWCNLQNRTFVVLNGLCELAPTRELLKRGATVYLIAHPATNGAANEICEFAHEQTSGKLVIPNTNLLEHLNDVVHWLERELQNSSATTICNVQHLSLEWALVCDALVEHICNALPDTIVNHVLTSNNNVYLVNSNANKARKVQERQTGGGKAPMGSAVRNEKHLGRLDSAQRTYFVKNSITGDDDLAVLAQLVAQWRIILARQVGTFRWLTDKRKHRVSAIVAVPSSPSKEEAAMLREITILLLIRDLRDPAASPTVQLDNSYQLYLNAAIH